jgi:hypothetical protein
MHRRLRACRRLGEEDVRGAQINDSGQEKCGNPALAGVRIRAEEGGSLASGRLPGCQETVCVPAFIRLKSREAVVARTYVFMREIQKADRKKEYFRRGVKNGLSALADKVDGGDGESGRVALNP